MSQNTVKQGGSKVTEFSRPRVGVRSYGLHPFYFVVSRRFSAPLPHPIRAGLAAMVVTVSMDNVVSIIGTKQPIRIVLFFPRIFCSVPVLVGNGIESRLSHCSLIRWQREVFRINDFETSLIALYLASQCA